MAQAQVPFYVTGGTLRPDAPSYIERRADQELFTFLSQGEFCYVLTSRQMGKSSLMVRTASRLRANDHKVAVIDLTAFGQNVTVEQWYEAILSRIGSQLDLEDELEDYWKDHPSTPPLTRCITAIQEIALPRCFPVYSSAPSASDSDHRCLVLFFDEIDVVRSLPFSTDEFFVAIRECFHRRATDPAFRRLTFCLLGIASPSDLVRDPNITPFQLGRRIELADFTEAEARAFAAGMDRPGDVASAILQRILYWTNGHPYLTQVLCQAVAKSSNVAGPVGVDRLCERRFLSPQGREEDDNLMFVREWLLRSPCPRESVLGLYWRVHQGRSVPRKSADNLQEVLRLSGITRVEQTDLRVRNRVYHRVFDRGWVLAQSPQLAQRIRRRRRVALCAQAAAALFGVAVAAVLAARFISASSEARATLASTLPVDAAKPLPPRPPDATSDQIDLGPHYTLHLDGVWDVAAAGDNFSELPGGLRTFNGVTYDVRGAMRYEIKGETKQGSARIFIHRPVKTLHFLHAADGASKGVSTSWLGEYRIEFANGQSWTIPLGFNREMRDWRHPSAAGAKESPIPSAWRGSAALSTGKPAELFASSWTNPLPSVQVRSIYLSSPTPPAARAVLFAITIEPPSNSASKVMP